MFPQFNYVQFIDGIKYFIGNISNNEEVQAILNESYEHYSRDKELGSIFDDKIEAISIENGSVVFKMDKSQVDEAINYLNEIKINGDSLETLCYLTTWDKSQ